MVNFSIIWGINLSFHANKCMVTSKRNSRIQQIGDHHYSIMWVGEWVPTSGGAGNNCTSALLPPGLLFIFSSLFLIRNGLKKTLSVGTYYGPTATRGAPKLFLQKKKHKKFIWLHRRSHTQHGLNALF